MPPKKQPFTTEQEYLLIDAVKSRSLLWDVSHRMYRRNDIKETLWQEIADLIGPHVTVEIVRERFINMRTTFINNEKRIRESKQRCSGKGTDEIYKPKWSFYTSSLFLKKACVQTESSSNLDISEDNNSQALTLTNNNKEVDNEFLADSVQKNVHFDSNLQKWVLMSADRINTDASNLLTVCQDANNKVLNPSLDHTYFPENIIEQSSVKTNSLPTHVSVSPTENTSIERTGFSCTPSSSSEGIFDVTNSQLLASEKEQNFRLTSTSPSSSNSTSSVLQDKKRANKDLVYVKRGAMKKITIMQEAVEALKKISNEKMPQILEPSSQISHSADVCEHLGLFIAARLREMEPDIRLLCEIEIMKILNTITTTAERREKNAY